MNKCVFLDRDGVLNEDRVDYVYRVEDFIIPNGVIAGLEKLKRAGYKLVIITNQSGIAKGIYKAADVMKCHEYLQEKCGNIIDAIYFCPHHPKYDSESLLRKPDSLMIEKAMAKYKIDPKVSYFIGDAERDIQAGKKAGVRTIHIANGKENTKLADMQCENLLAAAEYIERGQ